MKKLFALLLAAMMLLSLAACGKKPADAPGNDTGSSEQQQQNDGNSGDAPSKDIKVNSYSTAYSFYTEMTDKLGTFVSGIIDDNNARLEEENPDGYFSDPAYMILIYTPFLSMDMAFTSGVSADADPSSITMTYKFLGLEDAEYTKISDSEYKITYTTEDWETNEPESVEEFMKYKDGSMRYEQRINGELDEFYEFVSLGNDRYALQSRTHRALVTYKDGVFSEIIHSWTLYETDWETDEIEPWSAWYESDEDSIWGEKSLDESWVRELEGDRALAKILEYKGETLTVSGIKTETDWESGEVTLVDIEPVVIKVQ